MWEKEAILCWAIPIEMDLEGSKDLGLVLDGLWIAATLVIVLTPTIIQTHPQLTPNTTTKKKQKRPKQKFLSRLDEATAKYQ